MSFFIHPKKITTFVSCLLLASCGGGDSPNTAEKSTNIAPTIADMVSGQVVERDSFSFTADTTDSDGSIISYQWQQTSGTSVDDLIANSDTLTFTAPNITTDETLKFTLTVTDNNNVTSSADIDISVEAYNEISTVTFHDAGLALCLQNTNNADVGIEQIVCDGTSILSLKDISKFDNLSSLTITNANLQDISALSEFNQLTLLDLSNNNIIDASPVNSLTQLVNLNLSHNYINSYNSNGINLSALTKLTHISLASLNKNSRWNNIDLAQLEQASELSYLHISNAEITNIQSLADHNTALQTLKLVKLGSSLNSLSFILPLHNIKEIDVSNNSNLQDLSALSAKVSLEKLNISNLGVADYSPISKLVNLTELKINYSYYYYTNTLDLNVLSEMSKLSVLELDNITSLSNLSVLETFTQLKELSLRNINTATIAPLASLVSLEILDISHNGRLGDISPLKDLINLTQLDLSNNHNLNDISPIKALTSLTSLNISNLYNRYQGTGIELEPLAHLKQLEQLIANHNTYTDISVLEEMSNLKELDISNANLSQLFDFSLLTQLVSLNISQNNLVTLTELENAPSLIELKAQYNDQLVDVSALSFTTKLKHLNLNHSIVTSIDALATAINLETVLMEGVYKLSSIDVLLSLPLLKEVNLNGNSVILCSDLDLLVQTFPLAVISRNYNCMEQPINESLIIDQGLLSCITRSSLDIADINYLRCRYDEIKSLEGIEQLTKLSELSLDNNNITDASALSSLTQLTRLSLSSNNLTDITALSTLTNLTWLNLNYNMIIDFSSLNQLTKLRSLQLSSNTITAFSNIANLSNLQELDLSNNELKDIALSSIPVYLHNFYLSGNNDLDCSQLNEIETNLELWSFSKPSHCM
ncbi:leucine-rich repeat domain-containing protein [Colwellia sp. D2M02]|uniref:leucine-rich repeat domain-containing protein n=1 Tax=Colwellia sp. D2M02 TaxID=2841562 RepID=UPI001C0999C7|nr:leucine-rich repeat domain-containing protein [Colwellia sp. D2M02]MBU2893455.1 leucine-rich repeat domain-containing protein [Colwellia sp. D2M02]